MNPYTIGVKSYSKVIPKVFLTPDHQVWGLLRKRQKILLMEKLTNGALVKLPKHWVSCDPSVYKVVPPEPCKPNYAKHMAPAIDQ